MFLCLRPRATTFACTGHIEGASHNTHNNGAQFYVSDTFVNGITTFLLFESMRRRHLGFSEIMLLFCIVGTAFGRNINAPE
jgi:hypothetical protein